MNKILLVCIFCLDIVIGQSDSLKAKWVQEKFNALSLKEKIGQLFIIRAYGKLDSTSILEVARQIKDLKVGGICFFQGDAVTQANLTNYYQSISEVPLFIAMDAEWSLGMRLKKDGFSFPKQMCLGAIQKNNIIYEVGKQTGAHLKRIGVNFNFAPVVDINSNPLNPIINERSFGSDRLNVTSKAFAYSKGLESQNVLSCAKHFPGHGDTDQDSHKELPLLSHSKERLDSLEMFPFRILSEQSIPSVMIGHLSVPSLDPDSNIISSHSHKIITGILREDFNYKGLIVTDALEMKAVSEKYLPGELELFSLMAGNDILLLSEHIDTAIEKIYHATLNGLVNISAINQSVLRILSAKYDIGLNGYLSIDTNKIKLDINPKISLVLKDKVYRNAVTLLRDKNNNVPIRNLEQKIVSINFGMDDLDFFQKRLTSYMPVDLYNFQSSKNENIFIEKVNSADLIIISLHKLNNKSKVNFGLSSEEFNFIQKLSERKKIILTLFGTPQIASHLTNANSIVLAYEDNELIQDIAAQLIFGSDEIEGKLPIFISKEFPAGTGITRPSLMRLGFAIPEVVGLDSDSLNNIQKLAYKIVDSKAAPGGQILIAKNNKIVFSESFGTLDYDSTHPVNIHTAYDIASLTKITSSAPSLMLLSDQQKMNLNDSISQYLPEFLGTNKQSLKIRDALLHQAKLLSWIPFYKATLISPDTLNIINSALYRNEKSDSFDIQITNNLFLLHGYKDTIYKAILNSKLHDSLRYLYSDLFFYFVPELIEKITGREFSEFTEHQFFKPLGMNTTCFQPMSHDLDLENIAPTEEDSYFRHQKIKACVHDMGSAMCGGISGHAGVFSTAEDLAKLMQCYLNFGNYGGKEYFNNTTVKYFTSRDPQLNRRALIFDLPELNNSETNYVSNLAPKSTFGHTGFTGTCAWADPVNNIVYIFLSNRTYPDGSKNLLHKSRFRVKIQDMIYKSFIKE